MFAAGFLMIDEWRFLIDYITLMLDACFIDDYWVMIDN